MQIQTTHLGEIALTNHANGRQAECVKLNEFRDFHAPCILKTIGTGRGYTEEEVNTLLSYTDTYYNQLVENGIPVPKRIETLAVEQGNEWNIIMVDEFLGNGEDLKKVMSRGGEESLRIGKEIIDFLHDLPEGQPDIPFSTILGDFKPDNFVEHEGKLYFIDYFGPKLYDKHGFVTPYNPDIEPASKETITSLCGDRRDSITRFLALTNMIDKQNVSELEAYAKEKYSDMPEVVSYIEEEVNGAYSRIDSFYKVKI